jgi:hypothetical protein
MSGTLVLSVLALVIACASAVSSIGRWFVMQKQIKVQNLLQLSQYLHQTEYRDARHKIRPGGLGEVDQDSLRKLCSSFDFAGLFVHEGLVSKRFFLNYWGTLFIFLWGRISSDLDKKCFGEVTGRDYYPYFCWLLKEAKKDEKRLSSRLSQLRAL